MFDLFQIWKSHSDTLYDNRTGKRLSPAPALLSTLVFSIIIEFLFQSPSDNLLIGIITVQSILVGFSFNALFFIANSKPSVASDDDSLEGDERVKKLNVISKELFHNLSFFNFLAIGCLAASVCSLMGSNDVNEEWLFIHSLIFSIPYAIIYWADMLRNILRELVHVTLYFTLITGTLTFVRVVSKISFLFQRRIVP